MIEKKRLRRKCELCSGIFDVRRPTDTDGYHWLSGAEVNRVSWSVNPYALEIHGDSTLLWLCDDCSYAESQEI